MEKSNVSAIASPQSEIVSNEAMGGMYAESNQELLFGLKSTIDRSGRYNYKLEDYALGYAAGAGMSSRAAKREISEKFEKQFGIAPKQYLERSWEQNRTQRHSQHEKSKENDNSRGR